MMVFCKKGKKAQIEVQFNWIFVLIVGAVILVFFIAIVNVQKKAADKNLAYDILGKIDLIISGALTIPKTGQIFDMPRIDFNFQCDRISAFGVDKQFQDRIVFGPDLLRGRQLIVWSQDWNVPYKTANFLYVTSDNVRYIIYYNVTEQDANELNTELPDNITKEIVHANDFSGLEDRNNYKVRMIFLGDAYYTDIHNSDFLPQFMKDMPDSAVTAVQFFENDVMFYEKRGDMLVANEGLTVKILGKPMKYGAIFAEDLEMFNCSYYKAFKKLVYVSRVYSRRESALNISYADNNDCKGQARADTEIDQIAEAANSTPPDIVGIESSEGTIATKNNNALERSCAPVY